MAMNHNPCVFALERIFLKIIKGGIFILPFIPLIVIPSIFFPYITGKNFLFRAVVEVVGTLWLALAILKREYRPRPTAVFWALSGLIAVAILSTAFSVDPFRSFWSNFE